MFAGNFGVIGAAAVAGLAVITPRRITARARENAPLLKLELERGEGKSVAERSPRPMAAIAGSRFGD